MGRILGLDYGHKRIGLATSDEDKKIAFEYEIWENKDFFKNIGELIKQKEIEKVILGYPLNLSGEETEKTKEVLNFKEQLESKLKLEVELTDERLTSKMAGSIIGSDKGVDALAAQMILQSYLDKQNKNVQENS